MGYVAVTGFYKDLSSFTRDEQTLTDFTGFPTAGGPEPALREGFVSRPSNTEGGDIKGVELTLSMAGDLLSESLHGFGVILSGSFVSSNIKQELGQPDSPIPGLSKEVWSGTVYFERWGFSSRLSLRHRSDYLANIATFGPRGRTFRTIEAETVLDAQLGYTFQSGPLEGVGIILQGFNLTNEPVSSYVDGDTRLVQDYQEYGASYSLGITYQF
jgi:iron complex outermembrane receptor protein